MMDDAKGDTRRRKEAIEEKIRSGDYAGAKALIHEIMEAFPRFEHASEMLTICDILCSAEIELPGCGIDWYFVLQLFPSDEADIKAQYQKLVSLLEPIRDDFLGTGLALKFIEEAFSVLSDPEKRAEFDSKRNKMSNMSVDPDGQIPFGSSLDPGNGITLERDVAEGDFETFALSKDKRTANEACSGNEDIGPSLEDLVDAKKKKRICSQEVSWVTAQVRSEEAARPHGMTAGEEGHRSCSTGARPETDFYDFDNKRKAELFSVGQVWVAYDEENMPRRYAQVERIISSEFQLYVSWLKHCPNSLNVKRWCAAGMPVTCGVFSLEVNKITLSGRRLFSHLLSDGMAKQQLEVYPKKGDVWATYRDWDIEWYFEPGIRKQCGFEMVEILTDYSKDWGVRVAYLMKVDGFKNVFQRYSRRRNESSSHIPTSKLLSFSHNVPAFRFLGGELSGIKDGMLELDPSSVPDNLVQEFTCGTVACAEAGPRVSEEANCSDEASFSQMSNPSTNVMDTGGSSPGIQRKSKWFPKDFAAEQVWAVYDGADAMPRLYVKINNVVSQNEVFVTFLEPHPMLDEEIQWVEDSLPIVCGVFRAGRETVNFEMSRFSHLVKCDRSSKKSFYRIFPQKGEVWAIYKNWSLNWKSSNLVRYECRVVEILSDFSEEAGISICSLIEVSGRMTFFQRQLHEGFQLTRQLSRLEMLSLSHRIPAFTVIGIKDRDIPKGSWHLEPDALPPKFPN